MDRQSVQSPVTFLSEIIARIIKYVIEGGAVAIAAYVIPPRKLPWDNVVMIALTAAAVFALLDLFAPAVGIGARQGVGFGLGFGMINQAPITLPGVPPPMA